MRLDLRPIALEHVNRRVGDVLHDRVVGKQVVILEDQTETRLRLLQDVLARIRGASVARDGHLEVAVGKLARIERFEQRRATQKRRLAAARRADDGNDLAVFDVDRDVLQNLDAAEALLDMSKMQDRAILRHYDAPLRFKTKDGLAVLIRQAPCAAGTGDEPHPPCRRDASAIRSRQAGAPIARASRGSSRASFRCVP